MMRKSKIVTVFLLLSAFIVSVCAGCVKSEGGGGGSNNDNDDKRPEWATEGFTVAETNIENMSLDLVGGIANLAKTATKERLTNAQPEVSWLVSADADLNGRKSAIDFAINYDVRDPGSLAMMLKFTPDGSKSPSTEAYFYADDENNGTLYMAMGAQKVAIPLPNTALAGIFPISSVDSTFLSQFLSGVLYTDSDIKYEYKDETGGKRTRHYIVSVNLKQTLSKIISSIKSTAENDETFAGYYDSISFMISAIFGIDADKIGTQLPASSLVVDFIVSDGVKEKSGSGKTTYLKIDFQIAASTNTDTVFHGEAFNGTMTFNKLQAISKVLGTDVIPAKTDKRFDDYYSYDQRAITATGKLYYNNEPDEIYDMELAFVYDGYEADGDKVSLVIVDPDTGECKFELYYSNHRAFIGIDDATSSYAFNLDFDTFIKEFEDYYSSKEQTDLLETVAYLLGSIQYYDDGKLSYNFNAAFFEKILNVDIDTLYTILQNSYAAAGGSGSIENYLGQAGIDLSNLVISRAFTVELDVNEQFVTVGGDIEIPAGVFAKQG